MGSSRRSCYVARCGDLRYGTAALASILELSIGGYIMSRTLLLVVLILILGGLRPTSAQDISVNRSNKTVEVTVTESVKVDPEVAVIEVGYHNYGRTQDLAFADNARVANQITQALSDAGIPREDIETETVKLGQLEPDEKWSAELRAERHFEAAQSWNVRVPVARAQSVLSLAIKSGANRVEDVDWQVKDPAALEAKACSAAMTKARALADQMVKGLGGKIVDLLYASNTARRPKGWPFSLQTETATLRAVRQDLEVKLFPKKVEEEATIHAIFAIE